MKYKEVGFRSFYRRFIAIEINAQIASVVKNYPGAGEADYVLTYCYYDREAGLTLDILCCCKKKDNDEFLFAPGLESERNIVRIGAAEELEAYRFDDEDGKLSEIFKDKLEMLSIYDPDEEGVEETREMTFLDPCRHEWYIDDVLVRLIKDDMPIEACWVRITGIGDHCLNGILLNEPDRDFGVHYGDTIAFYFSGNDDNPICVTILNS